MALYYRNVSNKINVNKQIFYNKILMTFKNSYRYINANFLIIYFVTIALNVFLSSTIYCNKPRKNSISLSLQLLFSNMKTLTSKQETRLQKKKKKSAALAQIVKLNDEDETIQKLHRRLSKDSDNVESISQNDRCLNKKSKLNSNTNCNNKNSPDKEIEPQPKQKRIKLELISQSEQNEKIKQKKSKEKSKNVHGIAEERFLSEEVTKKIEFIPEKNLEQEKVTIAPVEIEIEKLPVESVFNNKNTKEISEITYMSEKQAKDRRNRRGAPKLRLKELGENALLKVSHEKRVPIFLTDVQHLVMSTLIGNKSPFTPCRWFWLEKESKLTHSVVVVVEGISLFHFLSYESKFEECSKIFNNDYKFEVIMPQYKDNGIMEQLASVPITSSCRSKLIQQHGSLEAAIEIIKEPTSLIETLFPIDAQKEEKLIEQQQEQNLVVVEKSSNDTFPRTQLLLSVLQMVEEGYPLPLNGALAYKYKDYVFTKESYDMVTNQSPMFGVDCEMCRTITGAHELTRISIVDENLKPIYETLVRPTNKIVDYLTKYSGITPEMMMNASKTLNEVQNDVIQILPKDAILVGQSLNADLHAMKMMHPYVIDTSIIFNITGERRKKSKLQVLAKLFLDEMIQIHKDGHDSLEDSRASMKLVQLKLSKGIDFGDEILLGKKRANDIAATSLKDNLITHAVKNEKRTAIINSKEISSKLKNINKEITEATERQDTNNSDVHFYKIDGNKSAIHKTQEVAINYDLVITNLNVPTSHLELTRIEKTLTNIDKWINKIWESVAYRGLFVVIFGGAPGSSNGAAMMEIKNRSNNLDLETNSCAEITTT